MIKILKYSALVLVAITVISFPNRSLTPIAHAQDCLDYSEFYPDSAPLVGSLLSCGLSEGIAVHANTLYLATTTGLISFDVSDPANPVFLDRTLTPAQNLAVAGNYAGVINRDNDIQIIGVTDPSDLREVGSLPPPYNGEAIAIAARDDFLFVTIGPYWGLFCVVDISQPGAPVFLSQIPFTGDGYGLALKGDYAVVVGPYFDTPQSTISVFDISNPRAPFLVDAVYYSGWLSDVEIHGEYAYMVDEDSGILMVDLSNPGAIEIVGMVPGVAGLRSLTAGDGFLFAPLDTPNYPEMELVVIDVQVPLAPQIVGRGTYPHFCSDITTVGQQVYLATSADGMQVIDASVPQSPTMTDWAGLPGLPGYVSTTALSGSIAFASYGRKVGVIDLSTPSEPAVIGTASLNTNVRALWPLGDFLLVGGTGEPDDRFIVMDVTDPGEPTVVSRLAVSGSGDDIASLGPYAYVASYYDDLTVVDVSDPLQPRLVGDLDVFGQCIEVVEPYAYVGLLNLAILDLADPGAPQILSSIAVEGGVADIVVVGDLLLAASNWEGMSVFDVKDPTAPTFLASLDTPSRATAVDYLWPYAYVTDGLAGLLIVDISNPSSPAIVGLAETLGYARDVVVDESFICVGDSHYGIQIAWPACPSVAGQPDFGPGPRHPLPTLDIYPNPFNPRTTIRFECRESGPTQLGVFDLSGRRVVQLVDGWLAAGHQEEIWNGRDMSGRSVAAGQYLVRLKSRDGINVQKVILAK